MQGALENMELGDVTAAEARTVVSEFLKEGSEASYSRLYAALGAWLWKALDGRRRDDELRQWFDILRRTSAALTTKNAAYAERFRAFYDLLEMSIATSKVANVSEILSRQHVLAILQLLQDASPRPLEKAAIAAKLGLKPANLSRVLHMMANARLVERTSYGKQAHFCITREGSIALSKRESSVRTAQPAIALTAPPQVAAADAEEFFRHLVTAAFHNRAFKAGLGPVPMPVYGSAMSTAKSEGVINLLQMLANVSHLSPQTPQAPAPAQAQQVKRGGKRFFGGVQVVTISEKKPETHKAHLLVEPVHQHKATHFMLHAYKEENENHVD